MLVRRKVPYPPNHVDRSVRESEKRHSPRLFGSALQLVERREVKEVGGLIGREPDGMVSLFALQVP